MRDLTPTRRVETATATRGFRQPVKHAGTAFLQLLLSFLSECVNSLKIHHGGNSNYLLYICFLFGYRLPFGLLLSI